MTIHSDIEIMIRRALDEDIRSGDVTSQACIDPLSRLKADVLLKEEGVVVGVDWLPMIYRILDPTASVTLYAHDGDFLNKGTVLATIEGHAQALLATERVSLNIMQHASGVATLTRRFVEAVKPFKCDILDTRKTLPGIRRLQKYAVVKGGGCNHRFALNDRFLIKDNHLAFLSQMTDEPIMLGVKKARDLNPSLLVEVEVENFDQINEALRAQADIIMLDNMSVVDVEKAVKIIGNKAYIEASGGMNLTTVRNYAQAGVNGISVGALTHSVKSIDISLDVNVI